MLEQQSIFDFDLNRIIRIFRKFWYLPLLALVIGLACSALLAWNMPKKYKATLKLFVWNKTVFDMQNAMREKIILSNDQSPQMTTYGNMIRQARELGLSLVNDSKLLLDTRTVRDKVERQLKTQGLSTPYKINIKSNRDSNLLEIIATSTDPKTAQLAADYTMSTFETEQQKWLGDKFVQLIEPAELPTKPFAPQKVLFLLAGMFLGLLAGTVAAFVLDAFDFTIKTSEDIERLHLLYLGSLSKQEDIISMFKNNSGDLSHSRRTLLDELQLIKTNLRHRNIENPQRCILITSDTPGCGKSTFAVLLAGALTTNEQKVLLIDCDLRKPTLHSKIDVTSANGGLVDYLLAATDGDADVNDYIVPTAINNVFLMPFGQIPQQPADFLESKLFANMLENLETKYRYILLDAPPIRGFADAFAAAQNADGIILVACSAKSRIDYMKRIMGEWSTINHKILGAVINMQSHNANTAYYANYNYHVK